MEVRKNVRPIQIDFKCPKCENGYLRPSGTVLTTYPPQVPHHCNNEDCDYRGTFMDISYPYLIWEEI